MGKVEFDESGKPYIMVPCHIRRGRSLVIETSRGVSDIASEPLPKSLILAHQYADMLESGKFATVLELSKKLKTDRAHIARILSLVNLAPDIVEAVMSGDAPEALTLAKINRLGIPDDWEEQRALFGFANGMSDEEER